MTGEDLGIELLRSTAAIQTGKKLKNVESVDNITAASEQLSKPEYDNFYFMTQIGNLIIGLSKQEVSFVNQFYRWFNGIESEAGEILRAEMTVKENTGMNTTHLKTLLNFESDSHSNNLEGMKNNYALLHRAFRGLLASDSFMRILMKTYKVPFMKCYLYDVDEVVKSFDYLNAKIDELEKYVTKENDHVYKAFHKINADDLILDKDMLKLTEKVAFLSRFDSVALQWCSNYEVMLNNLMDFELFPNPDWIQYYLKFDGTKYGTLKYPAKDGYYSAEWGGIKWGK